VCAAAAGAWRYVRRRLRGRGVTGKFPVSRAAATERLQARPAEALQLIGIPPPQ
jgi:hypothetical protein